MWRQGDHRPELADTYRVVRGVFSIIGYSIIKSQARTVHRHDNDDETSNLPVDVAPIEETKRLISIYSTTSTRLLNNNMNE